MNALPYFISRYWYQIKRKSYSIRAFIPGLRQKHRIETMVGPLGFWKELRAYQLRALRANGLLPNHSLLDIGCGPLQGGIAFIRYLDSSHYVGVDHSEANLSAGYLQIGQYRLADKNPLLILAADFGAESLHGRQFDFLFACQIIYYFDEPMMLKLLEAVSKLMKRDGKFLTDVVGQAPPEYLTANHAAWMKRMNLHTVESLSPLAAKFGMKVKSLGEIEQYGYPRKLNLRTNLMLEVRFA